MGDVVILVRLPVDWPMLRRLLATPRFSGFEFLAMTVVIRILTAPKLTPKRKKRRTIEG
jgi:hypothetical protein